MPNKGQIKLIQTAVRKAGLRYGKGGDKRYRVLLSQYKRSDGCPVTSCKQLTNLQIDDLLAICEARGFRVPGRPDDYLRRKAGKRDESISVAQRQAIDYLAGDLGWGHEQVAGFIGRMTGGAIDSVMLLSPAQGYAVIEGLKAIFGRSRGRSYTNLKQIEDDLKGGTDAESQIHRQAC